jgi:transposase
MCTLWKARVSFDAVVPDALHASCSDIVGQQPFPILSAVSLELTCQATSASGLLMRLPPVGRQTGFSEMRCGDTSSSLNLRFVGNSAVITAGCRRPGAASGPHGINIGMRYTRDITDEQWETLDPLIPKPRRRRDGRGRPWTSRRSVMNGVLWVLRTGAPWADLPERYPSFQTCDRRFQQWVRSGVMARIMTALAHKLITRGAIDIREAFIDASFAPAKKGD